MKVSRSTLRTLTSCQLEGYLKYLALEGGIQPVGRRPALIIGEYVHHLCMSKLAGIESELTCQTWFEDYQEDDAKPIWHLIESLYLIWSKFRLPEILDEFEVLAVEKEDIISLGNHSIMVKPDARLLHKETGRVHALEMKTHSYNRADYYEAWQSDLQTLMHVWAMRELFPDKEASHVLMEFLYKGYAKKVKGIKQYYSPLLRAYRKVGVPPFDETEYLFEYTRRKDYDQFNVWEDFTPEQWLDLLPEQYQLQQISALPIHRMESEIDLWEKLTIARLDRADEGLIELAKDPEAVIRYFPGNYNELCMNNKYGYRCDMYEACYTHKSPEQSLASGEYIIREKHYESE